MVFINYVPKKGKNRHRKGKKPTPKRERTDTFLAKRKYYDLITNVKKRAFIQYVI